MTKGKVISETPMNTVQVKTLLETLKEKDKELTYRSQKTLEALQGVVSIDQKKADLLFKKIHELAIPRLREQQIHKLIDVYPQNIKDVKTALQNYALSITNENMQKIADLFIEAKI